MYFDSMHTILFVLILLLAAYIVYLHVRLTRKNLTIESLVRKVSGIEKELSGEEIRNLINEIHNFRGKALLFDDKLFEEEISDFIFSSLKDCSTYIHYTMDEAVAKKIVSDGFLFVETFYKTALQITNDKLDLIIKHNNKKLYGDFIIVLCISNEIVKYYSSELAASGIKDHSFENLLTEVPPSRNENSDLVYNLSPHFIKGYLNYRTGVIFRNPSFDPGFSSPAFSNNIARLKDK